MENKTKITLPSVEELPEIMQAMQYEAVKFPLTPDFAIANGAYHRSHNKDGRPYFAGRVWTRSISTVDPRNVVACDFSKDVNGVLGDCMTNRCDVGVMPRFQNPAAMGVGVTNWQGQSVLTFKDKIAAYPRYNNSKAARLREALLGKAQPIGQYHSRHFDYHGNCVAKVSDAFHYNFDQQDYVYLRDAHPKISKSGIYLVNGNVCNSHRDYWFVLRPVRAMRCQDGSVQVLDQLAPCPFEPGKFNSIYNHRHFKAGQELATNIFYIGEFLNEMLQDLERSVEFTNFKSKLSKQSASFGQNGLRNRDWTKPAAPEMELY